MKLSHRLVSPVPMAVLGPNRPSFPIWLSDLQLVRCMWTRKVSQIIQPRPSQWFLLELTGPSVITVHFIYLTVLIFQKLIGPADHLSFLRRAALFGWNHRASIYSSKGVVNSAVPISSAMPILLYPTFFLHSAAFRNA